MSFADDLRKIKHVDKNSIEGKINIIKHMCGYITAEKIKYVCTQAAKDGKRSAVVEEDFFSYGGCTFGADFRKKRFWKSRKSYEQQIIDKVVYEIIGSKAENLGLELEGVGSFYTSNLDCPNFYTLRATFRW